MAMEGRVYSQTFTVDWAGGNAPHLLSLDTNGGNSLPNGLSLRLDNGSWKIMGIPAVGSAGGPFGIGDDYFLDIFAQANFHGFPFGNDTFHTLKVVEAIVVTVASHGVLVEGMPYNVQLLPTLTISGGTAPYSFQTVTGLPPGLQLDASGAISGTPSADAAEGSPYSLSITVQDSSVPAFSLTKVFELEVLPSLTLVTTDLPVAEEHEAYSTQIEVSGGTSPYTVEYLSGLPPGLSIDSDGIISGTPFCGATEIGLWNIALRITDSTNPPLTVNTTGALSLGVDGNLLNIENNALAPGEEGVDYSVPLNASGDIGDLHWSAEGLPQGMSVARLGGVWQLFGVPVLGSSGGYTVTITLEESDAFGSHTVSVPFALNIAAPSDSTIPRILNTLLPQGVEDETYLMTTLRASGGEAPYRFTVSGLPAGLELVSGAQTSWIGGTPEIGTAGSGVAKKYVVIVGVTDAAGATTNVAFDLFIFPAIHSASTDDTVAPSDSNLAALTGAAAAGACAMTSAVWTPGAAVLMAMLMVMAIGVKRRSSEQNSTRA